MEKDRVKYKTYVGAPPEKILQDMVHLYSNIFSDADIKFFKQRVKAQPELFSVLAYDTESLVGFKMGYPYKEGTFYSWIGGVLSPYRQKGIAKQLALLQEQWAKENGFTKLRTKSMNRFKAMMILNLKNGFNITNVYTNARGQTKVVFEKHLG